jgi:hypothetical protein
VNRSKLIEKGDLNVRVRQPKPYEMGLQVPHSFHPEMSAKGALRQGSSKSWRSVSRVGEAEGMSNPGRALVPGSRAYGNSDSAEVLGFPRDGIHQGQECDSDGPRFHGAASGAITFGHGGTSYRPSALAKVRFASTSATRKRTTRNLTNSVCFSITKNSTT